MNYPELVTIARLAQRWSANADPKLAYIRLLARHNFFDAVTEYWAQRGGAPEAVYSRRDAADIEFANDLLQHRFSGREKAHEHDAISNH